MTLNLILNSSNVVAGSNNCTYKYNFLQPTEIFEDAQMTISNVVLPYSWFNITALNKNNTFTIYFPDSTSTGTGLARLL